MPSVPAAFVAAVESAFVQRRGQRFAMALSGGSTAKRCYEALRASRSIQWSNVDLFWGDERCVQLHDENSNWLLAREVLLDAVGPVGSATPMRGELGADAYAALLPGVFDFVHLGLGPDGHTASMFPGSPELDTPASIRVVATHDPTGVNKFDRLSITFGEIARAGCVVVTVEGAVKQWAIQQVLAGADVPASRLNNAQLTWIVDFEALGLTDTVASQPQNSKVTP